VALTVLKPDRPARQASESSQRALELAGVEA